MICASVSLGAPVADEAAGGASDAEADAESAAKADGADEAAEADARVAGPESLAHATAPSETSARIVEVRSMGRAG
jgi:hypothetical protein